ncbi:hypothetical protein BB561_005957 [Smittium simulii]|uniref:Inorganic phosphate transporter n=1 Tax=Smittium simulii TaxID=133385 RepID=A0A2T9Y7C7_9FUNG|nr:hypothetical protein BB561_005957 [Smittium simulii]
MSANVIFEQVMQMGLMFGSIRAASVLGWDKPENINTLRTFFGTATIIYYTMSFIIWQLAKSTKDETPLIYEEPVNGQEEPEKFETTVSVYDIAQIEKLVKSAAFSTALIIGLHAYFKITQPLIIQSVLPLFSLFKSPLFGIYILRMKAEGSFQRPWVTKSAFGNTLNTPAQADTAPDAKAADKSISDKKSE